MIQNLNQPVETVAKYLFPSTIYSWWVQAAPEVSSAAVSTIWNSGDHAAAIWVSWAGSNLNTAWLQAHSTVSELKNPSRRLPGLAMVLYQHIRLDLVILHNCPPSHKDSELLRSASLEYLCSGSCCSLNLPTEGLMLVSLALDLYCYNFIHLIRFHQFLTKWIRSETVLPFLGFLNAVVQTA